MKSELIDRFKAAREKAVLNVKQEPRFSEYFENSIEMAVKHQFNRDMWELHDDNGIIRIVDGDTPRIVVFNTVKYCVASGHDGTYEVELSKQEFTDLKKIYFGKYEPDNVYLRRIKAI